MKTKNKFKFNFSPPPVLSSCTNLRPKSQPENYLAKTKKNFTKFDNLKFSRNLDWNVIIQKALSLSQISYNSNSLGNENQTERNVLKLIHRSWFSPFLCVYQMKKAERRDTTEAFCSSVLIIFPAYYKNFSIAENSKVSLDLMLVKMSFIPIYYTLVLCIAAKLPSLSASSSVPFAAFDLLFCFVASRTLEQMIRRFHVTVSLSPSSTSFSITK